MSSAEVIEALVNAANNPTPGRKAQATRKLNLYAKSATGKNPVMVAAGIKARVSRIINGNV